MTVGDVLFYPESKAALEKRLVEEARRRRDIARVDGQKVAEEKGPNLLKHEAVHSRQWAEPVSADLFIASYGAQSLWSSLTEGDPAIGNKYEQEANLYWGLQTW